EHGHGLDALELVSNNVSPDTRSKTRGVLDRNPGVGATGSSDAHEVEVVGCYMTEFADPVETLADFVRGLKRRQVRPRHNTNTFLFSGPVD
ncbi:MAG: PHP-associated domain-containing protein, partial [Isosphaeraceae bacterium]